MNSVSNYYDHTIIRNLLTFIRRHECNKNDTICVEFAWHSKFLTNHLQFNSLFVFINEITKTLMHFVHTNKIPKRHLHGVRKVQKKRRVVDIFDIQSFVHDALSTLSKRETF